MNDGASQNDGTAAPPVIVFDLGGVLIDWNPEYLYRKLIPDEALRRHFLSEVCSPAWNDAQDRGRSWAEGVAEASTRHPEHAKNIAAYDTRWGEMIGGRIPGMAELIAELKSAGHALYAITNFSADKLALAARGFPELTDFDGMAISGELGIAKPEPEIYLWLCDRYGLTPARCLFIDDRAENVRAAENLGMQGHHFRSTKELRIDLTARGAL